MKTSSLTGKHLNYWVCKSLGYVDFPDDSIEHGGWWYADPDKAPFCRRVPKRDCEPEDYFDILYIIKLFRINVIPNRPIHLNSWTAVIQKLGPDPISLKTVALETHEETADTLELAVLRCVVRSVYGNEVPHNDSCVY